MALGASLAVFGPGLVGIDARWGVAGITIGAGVAGWLEFVLLRRAMTRRIGMVSLPARTLLALWGAAGMAAALAVAVRMVNAGAPALVRIGLVLSIYGVTYWLATWRLGIPEAVALRERVFRRRR
jgi:putative peptidoglycan lipid II flippase